MQSWGERATATCRGKRAALRVLGCERPKDRAHSLASLRFLAPPRTGTDRMVNKIKLILSEIDKKINCAV